MNGVSDRFAAIQDLFEKASALEAAQRESFIQETCADDAEMAQELRSLLAVNEGTELRSGVTNILANATRTLARKSYEELIGTRVGAYKLVSMLGWGGSGVVYLAERADQQYAAKVAIKIVDEAVSTDASSTRYRIERQILAALNHPNIARLIDAGEIQRHPYIVMEYVEGKSVTRYCDDNRLDIEARLQLFLQICGTVQYAHQNLVVHRDLKPSNILVTTDGTPKLLDFGIAKMLASPQGSIALTRVNDRPLTPEYASPEQITGQAITTTSDVYALGVILYELLAGVPPYKVCLNDPVQLHRTICIVDPPKPSTAVAAAIDGEQADDRKILLEAANTRGTTPARLCETLKGDLDAIIMRALRKEPERRYSSAEALAADIQRYLDIEPVKARQGNWVYYSARFIRKHAVSVTAAAVIAVSLVASATVSAVLYKKALHERDTAQRVSEFMSAIFTRVNPDVAQGRQLTARELLDTASSTLSTINDNPEIRAILLQQLGDAYQNLGAYVQSRSMLQQSLVQQRTAVSTPPELLPKTLISLGKTQSALGEFGTAESNFAEAERLLLDQPNAKSMRIHLLLGMGRFELIRGNLERAKKAYLEAAGLSRELGKSAATDLCTALLGLVTVYNWQNDFVSAERIAREALPVFQSTLPEEHPDSIGFYMQLGDLLMQQGHVDEASKVIERTVDVSRATDGVNGSSLARSLDTLARLRIAQGKMREAEDIYLECLDLMRHAVGENHFEMGVFQTALGATYYLNGKLPPAKEWLLKSLSVLNASLPANHVYIAAAKHWLGETLLKTGEIKQARATLTEALQAWQVSDAGAWYRARTESALAEALIRQGEVENGERLLRSSYDVLLKERGPQDDSTRLARSRLDSLSKPSGGARSTLSASTLPN